MKQQGLKSSNVILIKNRRILTRTEQSKQKLIHNLNYNKFLNQSSKKHNHQKPKNINHNQTQQKNINQEVISEGIFWKTTKRRIKSQTQQNTISQSLNQGKDEKKQLQISRLKTQKREFKNSSKKNGPFSKMFSVYRDKMSSQKNFQGNGCKNNKTKSHQKLIKIFETDQLIKELNRNRKKDVSRKIYTQNSQKFSGINDSYQNYFQQKQKIQNLTQDQSLLKLLENLSVAKKRRLRINSQQYCLNLKLKAYLNQKPISIQVQESSEKIKLLNKSQQNSIIGQVKLPQKILSKIKKINGSQFQNKVKGENKIFQLMKSNNNLYRQSKQLKNSQKYKQTDVQSIQTTGLQETISIQDIQIIPQLDLIAKIGSNKIQKSQVKNKSKYFKSNEADQTCNQIQQNTKQNLSQLKLKKNGHQNQNHDKQIDIIGSNKLLKQEKNKKKYDTAQIDFVDEVFCVQVQKQKKLKNQQIITSENTITKNSQQLHNQLNSMSNYSLIAKPSSKNKHPVIDKSHNNKKLLPKDNQKQIQIEQFTDYKKQSVIQKQQSMSLSTQKDKTDKRLQKISVNMQSQQKTNPNQARQKQYLTKQQKIQQSKLQFQKTKKLIEYITCTGQVASYCSELFNKKNSSWLIPSLLLYRYCQQFNQDVKPVYQMAFKNKICVQSQYKIFVNQLQVLVENFNKIYFKCKKKGLIKQPIQSLLKNNQNKIRKNKDYYRILFDEITNFVKPMMENFQTKQDQQKRKQLICGIRMITAFMKALKTQYVTLKPSDKLGDNSKNPLQKKIKIPDLELNNMTLKQSEVFLPQIYADMLQSIKLLKNELKSS